MASLHISLTDQLEEFTREKVKSGLYGNASEVVRESLRLMIHRDRDMEKVRESIAEGFQQVRDGNYVEINSTEEFMAMARGDRAK